MEPNWCSCFQLDHKVVWKCFLHIQPKQAQSQWVSVDSLVVHASPVNILVHTNWNWNRTQLKPLCPGCMLKATEPQHSHCQSVERLKICFMAYNKIFITSHLQCVKNLFHGLQQDGHYWSLAVHWKSVSWIMAHCGAERELYMSFISCLCITQSEPFPV